MSKLFAFVVIAFAAAVPAAQPRVHTVPVFQTLEWPLGGDYPNFLAENVAIDGDSIIVLVDKSQDEYPTTRVALLYRRGTDGRWAFSRILAQVTAPRDDLRAELAMKNNIAVIKLHRDDASIWEKIGGNWAEATIASGGLFESGGFAISGSRILAGASGCFDDGVIYEKSGSGAWLVTGRIGPDAHACGTDEPRIVELNYDYAFIRNSPTLFRSYRKNGSALAWAANRTISLPTPSEGPIGVQQSVAVTPGNRYFTRGTNWNYAGQLKPIDYAMGTGDTGKAIFRDGVVVTHEGWDVPDHGASPYLYVPNTSGGFDHVGILGAAGTFTSDFDISGKTIVAAGGTDLGFIQGDVWVYVLPASLVAPPATANNFDAQNVSGFTLTPGNGFALAGNSSNYYFRQTVAGRDTAAAYDDTDWRDYQGIEADVTPQSWDLPESWSGVAVRYVDDNNYYFAGINHGSFVLGRKLNGVFTILGKRTSNIAPIANHHISLSIWGNKLYAYDAGENQLTAVDTNLAHGRAALVTHRARANYDNTYVKPTAGPTTFSQEYSYYVFGRELTYLGGNWQQPEAGLQQSDTSGSAFAIVPNPPIDDQTIRASARLDSWGGANPVSWFGLVARYVDPQNYYYLSVRSSNSLQIRKVVNGVVTVLKGVTLTIQPGDDHNYALELRGNELSASVDGVVLARAIDSSLTSGQYGFATYRAGATYTLVSAYQP